MQFLYDLVSYLLLEGSIMLAILTNSQRVAISRKNGEEREEEVIHVL